MIDKDVILALLFIVGALVNIWYTRVRTQGTVDVTKAEEDADESKRRSALEDKRLEVWSQMVMALQKTTERLDSMTTGQRQSNQISTQQSEIMERQAALLKDQGETLETARDVLSGEAIAQEAYRKRGNVAIDIINGLPARLDAIPPRLDALHVKMDELPAIVKQAFDALILERDNASLARDNAMKQVTALLAEISVRDATIAQQEKSLIDKDKTIADLNGQIAALKVPAVVEAKPEALPGVSVQ